MNGNTEESHQGSISLYKKLLTFSRPYRVHVIFISILLLVDVFYNLFNVWVQKHLIEAIDQGGMKRLRELIYAVFGIYMIFSIVNSFQRMLRFDYEQKVNKSMAESFFHKINRLSLNRLREKHTSDWMTRLKRDISLASGITGRLSQNLIFQSAMLIVAFCYVSTISMKHAVWLLALAPVPFLVGRMFDKKTRMFSKQISKQNAEVRGVLQETLHGIQDIKVYGMENVSLRKYAMKLQELNRISMRRSLFTTTAGQTIRLLNEAIRLLIFAFIVWLAIYHSLTVGAVLAFMLLIGRLQGPFNSSSRIIGTVQEGFASAERLYSVFDLEDEGKYDAGPDAGLKSERNDAAIHISKLRFSYSEDDGGEPLFDQFDLEIKKGEIVAIVGPSGSGKTTLARLCCGLYEFAEGTIVVNGRSVREELSKVRADIAYVPQDPFLFTGSIYENIVLDSESATEQDVIEAAKQAHLWDNISAKPNGLHEPVKELGKSLSGGQKQKIAIARAFMQNPNLYIFDEITSALDAESERAVNQSIQRLTEGKTAILITHRMTSVHMATKIIVMDKGKIVEQGTHQQLMDRKGTYAASLYELQMTVPLRR
ncbi:MAG: hypothetical protein K0R28_607 [Paenibacillus sp.]|nr:hypothetical protein [Paenibacillus sp.]